MATAPVAPLCTAPRLTPTQSHFLNTASGDAVVTSFPWPVELDQVVSPLDTGHIISEGQNYKFIFFNNLPGTPSQWINVDNYTYTVTSNTGNCGWSNSAIGTFSTQLSVSTSTCVSAGTNAMVITIPTSLLTTCFGLPNTVAGASVSSIRGSFTITQSSSLMLGGSVNNLFYSNVIGQNIQIPSSSTLTFPINLPFVSLMENINIDSVVSADSSVVVTLVSPFTYAILPTTATVTFQVQTVTKLNVLVASLALASSMTGSPVLSATLVSTTPGTANSPPVAIATQLWTVTITVSSSSGTCSAFSGTVIGITPQLCLGDGTVNSLSANTYCNVQWTPVTSSSTTNFNIDKSSVAGTSCALRGTISSFDISAYIQDSNIAATSANLATRPASLQSSQLAITGNIASTTSAFRVGNFWRVYFKSNNATRANYFIELKHLYIRDTSSADAAIQYIFYNNKPVGTTAVGWPWVYSPYVPGYFYYSFPAYILEKNIGFTNVTNPSRFGVARAGRSSTYQYVATMMITPVTPSFGSGYQPIPRRDSRSSETVLAVGSFTPDSESVSTEGKVSVGASSGKNSKISGLVAGSVGAGMALAFAGL